MKKKEKVNLRTLYRYKILKKGERFYVKSKKFTADFETATWLEDETYVWAWATCEIGNEENIQMGNSIEKFIEFLQKEKNSTWYFHNEKFDGEFIIWWLEKNGYKWVKDKKHAKTKTYTTIISDMRTIL